MLTVSVLPYGSTFFAEKAVQSECFMIYMPLPLHFRENRGKIVLKSIKTEKRADGGIFVVLPQPAQRKGENFYIL
ncbi:MAG: hypothetical protein ACI3XM_06945 [Eubacteriales bacterium]